VTEATAFIQWKGTEACLDWGCPCRPEEEWYTAHFDGFFADVLRCPHCGRVYTLPSHLPMTLTTDPETVALARDCEPMDEEPS